MFNKLKGWKTVIFNTVALIVPVLELTEFKGLVTEHYLPFYMVIVGMGNLYLRSVTTSEMGKK